MAVASDRLVPAPPAHCLTAALDSGPRLSAPGRSWFLPAPDSRFKAAGLVSAQRQPSVASFVLGPI